MLLFLTELPLRERKGTSDAMDFDGSTGARMREDIGGAEGKRASMLSRPFVVYTGGKQKG